MFYEGTEKRLEITTKQDNLLQFPEQFWQEMIAQADASILSKIENKYIHAYLLSESSLFIWKNRVLLITCGSTHLVKAALFFQQKFHKEQLQSLLFHRHQALQPKLQKSSFAQDSLMLNSALQGVTQHWQGEYQGDLFFFGGLIRSELNNKNILMLHGLSGAFAQTLHTGKASCSEIVSALALAEFFPELLIDQFIFTPKGYSLNAITGQNYLTIHITPEKSSTYLSLESSFKSHIIAPYIKHLIRLFSPLRSQLMNFSNGNKDELQVTVENI
jgi:S-adenosylmethionine decarboxylase